MALERKVCPSTGIYHDETTTICHQQTVYPGGAPEEVAADQLKLKRSYDIHALLEDSVTFATSLLKEYGVKRLNSRPPRIPKGFRIPLAGNYFLKIPLARPTSVKIRCAPVRASSIQLDLWWTATIRTAQRVLFEAREVKDDLVHARKLKDDLAAQKLLEALPHAYRLGWRVQELQVRLLEPRAMSGVRSRTAGLRGNLIYQKQIEDRNQKLQAGANCLRKERSRLKLPSMSTRSIARILYIGALNNAENDRRQRLGVAAIRKIISRKSSI